MLVFYKGEQKFDKVDVSMYANTCNDNSCQDHESHFDCPADCPSGGADDYCDKKADSICDPDCATGDPDCIEAPVETKGTVDTTKEQVPEKNVPVLEPVDDGTSLLWGVFFTLILLVLVALVIRFSRQSYAKEERIRDYIRDTRAQGYAMEQIRESLLQTYGETEIDRIITHYF